MRLDMTLDQMLELVELCNIIHFPQGIEVRRGDRGFHVSIVTRDGGLYPCGGGCNKTAQGALHDAMVYLASKSKDYVDFKRREAERVANAMDRLLAKEDSPHA